MKIVVDGVEHEVPRLTPAQRLAMVCWFDGTGALLNIEKSATPVWRELLSLGLVVEGDRSKHIAPCFLNGLTPLGCAVAAALASRVPS
jgi:hypothetical protein